MTRLLVAVRDAALFAAAVCEALLADSPVAVVEAPLYYDGLDDFLAAEWPRQAALLAHPANGGGS